MNNGTEHPFSYHVQDGKIVLPETPVFEHHDMEYRFLPMFPPVARDPQRSGQPAHQHRDKYRFALHAVQLTHESPSMWLLLQRQDVHCRVVLKQNLFLRHKPQAFSFLNLYIFRLPFQRRFLPHHKLQRFRLTSVASR